MLLYHYTAGEYLRAIAKEGLTVGDVPTDLARMRGRIGVWLTSSPDPTGHGLAGSQLDKERFRIAVDIDDNAPLLKQWSDWSASNVTQETRKALNNAAGDEGTDLSDTWWIYFGWIRPERLIGVVDIDAGEEVGDWSTFWPDYKSLPAVPFRRKESWQKKMLKDVRRAQAG